MSHLGIRKLIEDTAKKLGDNIQFDYARLSDSNLLRDKTYPFIQLDPLIANSSFSVNNTFLYSKTWSIAMVFFCLDRADSIQEEYAKLLDQADDLLDRFIIKLNFYTDQSDDIIIQNINQRPFIKTKLADIATGFILEFTITVPDNWNYCMDNDC